MSITLPTRVAEKSRRAECETAGVPLAYTELEPSREADAEVGPVVSLDHVSFCYEGEARLALRDVSLSVAPGSFVGVNGPSGAGKSTLCSVVSGAAPHHFAGTFRGTATIDGMDTCEVGLTDVSRVVGSVLQDIDSQMVAAGVEDELLFGLENFGVPRDQVEARLAWALDACGIADLRSRDIATLSGGQKQKVAIAAILALRPKVLVLDEPTAALDPASSRMVFQTLRDLNASGITVIVVERKAALLAEFSDRVVVLDGGHVVLDGSPRSVFARRGALREAGVDRPRVTLISDLLSQAGALPAEKSFLTVDEAVSGLLDVLPRAGAANPAASTRASQGRAGKVTCPPVSGEPVLRLRDVSYGYGRGRVAVSSVDLDVRPGELVAVVGENGAGKTTLTKLVAGLLRPTSGEVTVCGLDVRRARASEVARHVSTLFQNPDHQICRQTVLDEVAFGLVLQGVDPTEARERARGAVERFGLPAEAAPFALPRGRRQVVALASAMALEPRLLVLDEPTSGLDASERETVMGAVDEARQGGCAVVMVCHDMEVVSDFATRLVVMAEGRVLADGAPGEVFSRSDVLARARVAAPQVADVAGRLARAGLEAFSGVSDPRELAREAEGMVC